MIKKFMSRKITIERGDSICEYPLSIATVVYAPDGSIQDVKIEPYTCEIANVEYVDTPLYFVVKEG
jgi:hypothetical protein